MGKQNTRWNIFIWPIGSPFAPINLSRHDQTTLGSSEDAEILQRRADPWFTKRMAIYVRAFKFQYLSPLL